MMWVLAAVLVIAPGVDAEEWRLTATEPATWTVDGAEVGHTTPGEVLSAQGGVRFAADGPSDVAWSAMVRPAALGPAILIQPAWLAQHTPGQGPMRTAVESPGAWPPVTAAVLLAAAGVTRAKHP